MGEQYFSKSPASGHDPKQFTLKRAGRTLHFETDAGVFSRDHLDKGSALLIQSLPDVFSGRALDLGCGWGAVGVCMAAQWPAAQVVMTDVNERATALSRQNLTTNGLKADVYTGDGLDHLQGQFDLIATNPPIRAGKAVVYAMLQGSVLRLAPGGALYVVMRKQQGGDSAKAYLTTLGCQVETIARSAGFHVFRCILQG